MITGLVSAAAFQADHCHLQMKIGCYGSVIELQIYYSIAVGAAEKMATAIVASDLSFAPVAYGSRNSHADSDCYYLVAE